MEAIIRDNGIKINHMDMVSTIILITIGFIGGNGKLEKRMESDNKPILMVQFTRGIILMILNKEMEFLYLTLKSRLIRQTHRKIVKFRK